VYALALFVILHLVEREIAHNTRDAVDEPLRVDHYHLPQPGLVKPQHRTKRMEKAQHSGNFVHQDKTTVGEPTS
jgi:hypothetical protein